MTLQEFLNEKDVFAARAGAKIVLIEKGRAVAEMAVDKSHLNAGGVCQGGALFTLADLALAAVMNSHGKLTFSISSNIAFLKSARCGERLIAEAKERLDHRHIPYYNIDIHNETGDLIASMTAQGYRKEAELPVNELM